MANSSLWLSGELDVNFQVCDWSDATDPGLPLVENDTNHMSESGWYPTVKTDHELCYDLSCISASRKFHYILSIEIDLHEIPSQIILFHF